MGVVAIAVVDIAEAKARRPVIEPNENIPYRIDLKGTNLSRRRGSINAYGLACEDIAFTITELE